MNNQEFADYAERQATSIGHGTMVQQYFEIEYIGGRKADAETLQQALKAVSKTTGISSDALTVIEIERGLVEVYATKCKWLGAIATIMELQEQIDI